MKAFHQPRGPQPSVLQFNQSGAWRTVITFDAADMPPEFLQHADTLLRLAHATGRVMAGEKSSNGSIVASRQVTMTWSEQNGWRPE